MSTDAAATYPTLSVGFFLCPRRQLLLAKPLSTIPASASMLAMIDSAKSEDDAHPRIWAPFVVVGEPAKGN
jgi:hypothetical protein